jgi:hypothetical protein
MKKIWLTMAIIVALAAISITSHAQSGRIKSSGNKPANAATPTNPPVKVNTLVVPKGTVIKLHILNELSSKTAQRGEKLVLKTSEPVLINDKPVIPEEVEINCHIINAQAASRDSKNGSVTIGFDEVVWLNGDKLPISASLVSVINRTDKVLDKNGEGKVNSPAKSTSTPIRVAKGAGLGGVVGGIKGGIAGAGKGAATGAGSSMGRILIAKGKDVDLLAGSEMEISLDSDLKIPTPLIN